jgi:hypothetical protein
MTTCLTKQGEQPVTVIEAWSELERERQVRQRIYDNWVRDGKMAWADGRDRYARILEACRLLKRLVDLQPDTPSTLPVEEVAAE